MEILTMVNIDASGLAKLKDERLTDTLAAALAWLQTMCRPCGRAEPPTATRNAAYPLLRKAL